MFQPKLFVNAKSKIKMKKHANDPVNFEEEKKKDPKYKTEMCKTWVDTGVCPYGNKCRFAHGKHELVSKPITSCYKKKPCKSFETFGFCPYGSRCNFKHDERKLTDIPISYYYIQLFIKNNFTPNKRLKIFEEISSEKLDTYSDSTLSNDEGVIYEYDNDLKCMKEMDINVSYITRNLPNKQ